MTKLEPGTYTPSRSFSHTNYISPSRDFLCLPSPYVPVVGVPLYSDRLKTYASRLVKCVMVMGSAGDSKPVVDSVSCFFLAMLVQVHKAMGDEGFATRTDSSCG